MQPVNLLIVEDDTIVARTIERCLRGNEFKVTLASSGLEGLQSARRSLPDIVVLDVIMPGMDGYTVCREMRTDALLKDVPILFLTAKIKDEDKIKGLSSGADDYLTKPFNVDELILRLRAILRRTRRHSAVTEMEGSAAGRAVSQVQPPEEAKTPGSEYCKTIRNYVLNTRTFELTTPAMGKIRLTPVQYDLVYHLMTHPGEIFSPARLLDEVWDYPSDAGSPDLVRVHIKNLRERTEANPRSPVFIQTVPGYGYTIPADEPKDG